MGITGSKWSRSQHAKFALTMRNKREAQKIIDAIPVPDKASVSVDYIEAGRLVDRVWHSLTLEQKFKALDAVIRN